MHNFLAKGRKLEARRAESEGVGFGAASPPPAARGSQEHCMKLPSGVRDKALAANAFW